MPKESVQKRGIVLQRYNDGAAHEDAETLFQKQKLLITTTLCKSTSILTMLD